jgi:UPF0042 nucleotide-binding protein
MDFIIVTGMSGAGKSKVLDALEDIGYYCSDNIPPQFIKQFAEILKDKKRNIEKIALVVDTRAMDLFDGFLLSLLELNKENYNYKLLFVDTEDRILLNRYKEGRRKHHLGEEQSYSIIDSIEKERQLLAPVREISHFIIDTSLLAPSQLKRRVVELCLNDGSRGIVVVCMSFGFKNGLPPEADLVFDLRCLPNPFYIPELKERTGLEKDVQSYVMDHEDSREYFQKVDDFVNFTLPLYIQEGKSCLLIAFGCTGGKHRSVTFTELLARNLKEKKYKISVVHRDVNKINEY